MAVCDRVPIRCEPLKTFMREIDVPDDECTEAMPTLAAFDSVLEPEMQLTSVAVLMQQVFSTARVQNEDAARRFAESPEADTFTWNSTSMSDGSSSIELTEACPGSADFEGASPPAGHELYCVRKDGTRHGPALFWTEASEPARIARYRNGVLIDVDYPSGPADPKPSDFLCPDGTTLDTSREQGLVTKQCLRDGESVGAIMRWKGDCLVSKEDGQFFSGKRCP